MTAADDLVSVLEDDESGTGADEHFVAVALSRLDRARRRRRSGLVLAGGLGGLATLAGIWLAPGRTLPTVTIGPVDALCALVLVAACAVVWMGTDGSGR